MSEEVADSQAEFSADDRASFQQELRKKNSEAKGLRDRLAEAEARLQQFEDANKSVADQLAELTSTNENLARENLRLNVGLEKGLPKSLIGRLQGDDAEALAADAEALISLLPTDTKQTLFPPKADPSQGAKGETGTRDTAHQFAAAVEEAFTN